MCCRVGHDTSARHFKQNLKLVVNASRDAFLGKLTEYKVSYSNFFEYLIANIFASCEYTATDCQVYETLSIDLLSENRYP